MRVWTLLTLTAFCLTSLSFRTGAFAEPTPWAELYGEAGSHSVKLMWKVTERWPAGMIGFQICRRGVRLDDTPTEPWKLLHQKPILAGIYREKELANVETNAAERERLASKMLRHRK